MCSNCRDILGRNAILHDSDACPIIASAHCSYCAMWGVHFSCNCPYKPKSLSKKFKPITNTQAKIPEPCRILPDDPVMYIKILSQHDIEPYNTNKENRDKVKEILLERKTPLILANQPKQEIIDTLPPQTSTKLLKRKLVK